MYLCVCLALERFELRALEKELARDLKRGLKKELRRELKRWRI